MPHCRARPAALAHGRDLELDRGDLDADADVNGVPGVNSDVLVKFHLNRGGLRAAHEPGEKR